MKMEKNITEEKETIEKTEKPTWIKTKPEELQKIIKDLADQGKTPSQIGILLRDKHGIPKTKILGKKISQILKENDLKYTSEKEIIDKKIETIKNHLEKHKHDYTAKRSLTKKLWQAYHYKQLQ